MRGVDQHPVATMNQHRTLADPARRAPVTARRAALAIALAFARLAPAPARAQNSPAPASARPVDAMPPLATRLVALTSAARLGASAHVGLVVMDAASGTVLFDQHSSDALNPASNAKLVTAAAALALLGPDHTYLTRIAGRVEGHTVRGGIVLRGGGDPSLSTGDLFVMAHQIAARGIDRVDGGVLVDDRAFGSEHVPPAFEQQPREGAPFRTGVSAASVDGNLLALRVAPGAAEGAPAIVSLDPAGYADLTGTVTTEARGPASVGFDTSPATGGRELARVSGGFPLRAEPAVYRRRIDNPSLAAGYALRAALEAAGVHVHGAVRVDPVAADRPALVAHESAPLSTLLYEVGKDSNNFYAEMTLLAIGAGDRPPAVTFAHAIDRVRAWLHSVAIDDTGMVLRNGSGLYDANRVSPRQLAEVLRVMWRDPATRDEYIAHLAVPGDDGTLEHRIHVTGADRWVRAKTGTLDDVIALSGYVLSPDPGRTLVFSFLANGVRGHQSDARRLADRVAAELVTEQQRAR